MLLGTAKIDVAFVWDESGITAPVQMWVEEILLALPSDIQSKVLTEVIKRVEYINEEIAKAKLEEMEDEIDALAEETNEPTDI